MSVTELRPLDVPTIRADFPILDRTVRGGRPLVYLDNAASSQKPKQVIEALSDYYTRYNANVHRGIHTLSEEATDEYEKARRKLQRFIGAAHPEELLFVRNTTEGINLVAHSYGDGLKPGDEIVLTEMEHHSNLIPWQMLAQRKGLKLRFAPIFDDGTLDLEEFGRTLNDRTKLVAITHMSNVLGTINPVGEISSLAHEAGAKVLLDAAQSVPHIPVDVEAIDCDFLAFSGHKMLGPMGVGVLYGKRELLDAMPPFLGGGNMIMLVQLEEATYNELPDKFEAGTPDAGGAIALGVAVDYLSAVGMDNIQSHEQAITDYALEVLMSMPDVAVYGPKTGDQRGGVVSFNLGDIHPHDLGTVLDRAGVAVRAGHHCAQPLMRRLGQVATTRASFYLYNTREEVDVLAEALNDARKVFN